MPYRKAKDSIILIRPLISGSPSQSHEIPLRTDAVYLAPLQSEDGIHLTHCEGSHQGRGDNGGDDIKPPDDCQHGTIRFSIDDNGVDEPT